MKERKDTKRLEKYLVECGIGTRREIKKYVHEGKIKLNYKIILDESIHIREEIDIITFNDIKLTKKKLKYYMLNKISGYITAMKDEDGKKTVKDLLPSSLDTKGIFPVGRLDKDTEGLLIFTNDGDLSKLILSPENDCEKIYYVELDREIKESDIERLENNIKIDNHVCKSAKVHKISSKSINLTITEGKFHQVKKMIKAIDNKVNYLKRIKINNLALGDLKLGEIREIKRQDIL
ncbi:pseudouridine synthase [Fusobacterium sp. MFO224]|uniref:pseudouridine synthase n=1 Tax=Fusobacterium sp. MFO224 TaxID=3378070 RepID=UPI003854AA46